MTPTKWSGGKGSMYAVSQTVAAPKPVVGGRGVLFAMGMPMKIEFDTLVVMTNLTLKYPQAIKKAIVNAMEQSDGALDIVEPYAPKEAFCTQKNHERGSDFRYDRHGG